MKTTREQSIRVKFNERQVHRAIIRRMEKDRHLVYQLGLLLKIIKPEEVIRED